jgi:S-adenosylhomocysteine hydrolase
MADFNIEQFLDEALDRFFTEKEKKEKEDTVQDYAKKLKDVNLSEEKNLSLLTKETLIDLGVNLGHALSILSYRQGKLILCN